MFDSFKVELELGGTGWGYIQESDIELLKDFNDFVATNYVRIENIDGELYISGENFVVRGDNIMDAIDTLRDYCITHPKLEWP